MLFFREHDWMLAPGQSHFSVDIRLEHRAPEDVDWHLEMRFLASAARWRRVQQRERPSVEVAVRFFEPRVREWRELERLSFWDLARRERLISEAGYLEVRYQSAPGDKVMDSALNDHIWRVARRDGAYFTIELAAFADGRNIFKQLAETAVTPDGEAAPFEPDEAFWKANAQLYLIENIPLGVVRVEVPRNVRDPEAHARRQVQAWLGLDAPEFAQVWDFAIPAGESGEPAAEFEETAADLHAELQYHAYYET